MALGTINGVALVPGVSRNRRLYTPELINKAAKRMQERLADPNGLPIVMRTHHDAGDDSAKIVGRVTSVKVDNNSALRYEADLYDTFHGREIAGLVKPKSGKPALKSVSIHGYWMGDPRQVTYEGESATTADDLEIDAIDFTASPGVDGALIDSGSKARESAEGILLTPISESAEAAVTVLEEASGWADISHTVTEKGVTMTRGVQYELDTPKETKPAEDRWWIYEAKYSADDMKSMLSKGQAMKNASGEPSYPIADISDLKKAIRAVGRGKGSHDAIRRHIIKRAKALGAMNLIPDNWSAGGSNKETQIRYGELTEYYGGDMDSGGGAGFCIDAYAGPLSVTIRGCVDPDTLRFAAQRATAAAMNAVLMMDPDSDGDIADQDDFDDQGNFLGDDDDDTMAEQGTAAVGGVIPDDDMTDKYGESVAASDRTISINVKPVMDESALDLVLKQLAELQERLAPKAVADEAAMPPGDGHTHSHDGMGGHTHAHAHDHVNEAGKSYSHGHTHTHVHGSMDSDGGDHTHGHDHVHVTSPSATAETTQETENTLEESAVSETENKTAAEAAPTRLHPDDLKALGEMFADAIRAVGEQKEAKHAAAPQETTESVAETPAESAKESATPKAEDVAALKESLARELRKELRDEFRAEFLKENGLPPRRGYRVNETSEEEVELTDADVFNNHRVNILLGDYGMPAKTDDAAAA